MARWTIWAASAIGATVAGAGLAVARRPRSAPSAAAPAAAPGPDPATAPPRPAAPPVEDDPQAALDAARDRLRDRADALRREIESADGPAGGG